MEISGESEPFLPHRQPRDLFASLAQLLVRFDQQAAGNGGESNQQLIEELAGGRRNGFPASQLDHRGQDGEDNDGRHASPPREGGARHDDRVEEETAVLGRGP